MEFLLESISLILLGCLCVICTRSDLQTGFIYNKVLAVFAAFAVIIDVVYYGFFAVDLLPAFLTNIVVVTIVSLYLFCTHSFAGGDCKMTTVAALLLPARFYWMIGSSKITLIFVIGFALISGYCYLVGTSLLAIAQRKVKLTVDTIKQTFLRFLQSYIVATLYLCLLNSGFTVITNHNMPINIWITRGLCLAVAWCVGHFSVLRKRVVVMAVATLLIVISFATKTVPLSLNIENYVLTLILVVCQMAIKTTIYESVEVEQLRKGMILSAFSSVMMQRSITKGLPGISTEDLRSRLTDDEIVSIKIWAKATHTNSLTIVKKIPFAIFISNGYLLYCIVWGILICD